MTSKDTNKPDLGSLRTERARTLEKLSRQNEQLARLRELVTENEKRAADLDGQIAEIDRRIAEAMGEEPAPGSAPGG